MSRRATLLYDGDCGFCRWSIGWVLRRDRRDVLQPLAIQSAEGAHLLAPVPQAERLESWHLVLEDGRVFSGGEVFAPLLELLGRPFSARLLARAPRLTKPAYRSVAGRRQTLGPMVPRRAKRRADKLIRERAGSESLGGGRAESSPDPGPRGEPGRAPGPPRARQLPPGAPRAESAPTPAPPLQSESAPEPVSDPDPASESAPSASAIGWQQRFEESAFGRGLLSTVIVVTLIAIVAINLPASDLRRQLLRGGQPYLNAIGADQNWALFAPDPRRVVIDVWATVSFDDGATARWSFPHDDPVIGTYRDYRWRKWEENLINPSNSGALWRSAALWAAGSEARPGRAATSVALVERYAALAPPGVSPSLGPSQERVFYVLRLQPAGVTR